MILSGRLCEQSAIALVSDTIIHHKNTKRLCSLAQTEPVGDGVFWLFSEPVGGFGFNYLTQLTNFHGYIIGFINSSRRRNSNLSGGVGNICDSEYLSFADTATSKK